MRQVRDFLLVAAGKATNTRFGPVHLLAAAAIFHLVLTTSFYGVGRYGFLPGVFDSNGIVLPFTSDSAMNRTDAVVLSGLLTRGEIHAWLIAAYSPHVKLYSICFAIYGPLLGFNLIAAEPLNLLYYLALIALVFNLGREAFSRRVGLLAAVMVGLWPSLLLHSTQLLTDPLFLLLMLALILIILRSLRRTYSWPRALMLGVAGGLIGIMLWLVRHNMGEVVFATVLIGAGLLIAQQFGKERVQRTNLVAIALVVGLTLSAQQFLPELRKGKRAGASARTTVEQTPLPPGDAGAGQGVSSAQATAPQTPWTRAAARVIKVRRRFIVMYTGSGSNVDTDVQLNGMGDLVRYLPRAAAIGFFAPFPNMWFTPGKLVGSWGRLLAGLESLAMYACEGMAIFGLWRGRRRLSTWLLFLVAMMGMIALGLVVINVGALLRLRYAFLALMIILACEGAVGAFERFTKRPGEERSNFLELGTQ
jgi:hypothetical protein